jgi:hypothetical protein
MQARPAIGHEPDGTHTKVLQQSALGRRIQHVPNECANACHVG